MYDITTCRTKKLETIVHHTSKTNQTRERGNPHRTTGVVTSQHDGCREKYHKHSEVSLNIFFQEKLFLKHFLFFEKFKIRENYFYAFEVFYLNIYLFIMNVKIKLYNCHLLL